MRIESYFNFKNSKELLKWNNYSLIEAQIDFEWDKFFDLNADFKFCFSNRDGHLYLGLNHVEFSDFFQTFENLPSDIFYFYQQTFYRDKTKLLLPQIQIIKTQENTKAFYFKPLHEEPDITTYKETFSRNILLQETHQPDEHEWRDLFRITKRYLLENKKVVLSRKTQFRFKNRVHVQTFFLNLFKEGFYNYLVQTKFHYFLGSSPERLLKFQNNTFLTEAVAGTRSLDKKEELLNSPKDREEQQIVLDEILKSIRPLCSDIQVSETKLYEYKNLVHLKTEVRASPLTSNIFDWIQNIHPTPAVCGLPQDKAFTFLKNNEPYKRENYASCLGIIQRNHMDIAVSIRCAEVYRNLVTAYTGVGVVKESELDIEWQELDLKLENIKIALEI